MITDHCHQCGSKHLYLIEGNPHISLKCADCNSWIKFIKKNEISYYTGIRQYKMIKGSDNNDK